MSTALDVGRLFRDALAAGSTAENFPSDTALSRLTEEIREALLAFGSETPDNLACAQRIEYGVSIADGTAGLQITGSAVPLTDIAWALEEMPLPSSVREAIPALSDADWDAATRLIALILLSFERRALKQIG